MIFISYAYAGRRQVGAYVSAVRNSYFVEPNATEVESQDCGDLELEYNPL